MNILNAFISGALMFAFLTAGLFFLRFWKQTRDRFFAFLATTFWILAIERVVLLACGLREIENGMVYTLRLLAFLILLAGIFDKNMKK